MGRRKARLDHVAKESGNGALAISADVSNKHDVERIIEKTVSHFGRLDILLNNAGILVQGTAESLTEEDWDRMFNINVRGVWLLSRAALAPMRQAGGGSIINISSVLGLVGARKRAGYAATKGAVTLLTKCMAVDHAVDKIRVNCICPAFVETELTEAVIGGAADPERARQERVAMHPAGRLGLPEDVAGMAVYLASDESSWVTGAALMVDGGFTAV